MRVQLIDIGNSKGIRIPQAVLKQALMGDDLDMEIVDGKIVLKPFVDPAQVPEFDSLAELDDSAIQRTLRKLGESGGFDIVVALIGADDRTKEAVYRNMSERARAYVAAKVAELEKGDARDLLVARSRNLVSEAMMEIMRG